MEGKRNIHFDINQIIKAVYAQYPCHKRIDVVRALKSCNESWWISDNYLSFHHPLKHGEYNWKERIFLKTEEGGIFIDLMQDKRVGGIEFDFKYYGENNKR